MQRMTITPQLRTYVLNAVEAALLPPENIFPTPGSLIDNAKRTPEGRQKVKDLTLRAKTDEIGDIALAIEVFTDVLKARKLKLAKKRAADMAKQSQRLIARELKAEAKKVAKHQAEVAQRKADREAAKNANESAEAA